MDLGSGSAASSSGVVAVAIAVFAEEERSLVLEERSMAAAGMAEAGPADFVLEMVMKERSWKWRLVADSCMVVVEKYQELHHDSMKMLAYRRVVHLVSEA